MDSVGRYSEIIQITFTDEDIFILIDVWVFDSFHWRINL